ncbi:SDR family oxidoreductase [Streptomyces noursei]|uniref:SDR family oxidoreductase n=1 Tax=Streptomyces noursei TaxID=1971 RepID=UPI00167588C0|nr:SDR family oxidoreductase [Streptomyces noursei]MCZ1020931.1 SDR family oxidoreductase [Streptomyces noursei]GGX35088.1 hypothetical protein GCM10010341_65730 [Streptomyces noursei]
MWHIEEGHRHPYPRTEKQTLNVLLTGATGVVGSALLPYLGTHNVTCLIHATALNVPRAKTVCGDIRQPCLGLSRREFKELSAVIDVVVHAAADTSFDGKSDLVGTNVAGTERIVELARQAEARLVYISSAFSALGAGDQSTAPAYARSKAQAEEVVRASGLSAVVVRPSVIVGDSRTGHIAKHQGFHNLLGAMMRGQLPLVPLEPTRLLDFVPQDVVAKCIVELLENEFERTEVWLTAGSRALQVGHIADEVQAAAAALGRPVPATRFVDEDLYERLIVPVFLEVVPASTRRMIKTFAEQLTPYVADRGPFPSDVKELPDQVRTLRASMYRWANVSGFHPRNAAGAAR